MRTLTLTRQTIALVQVVSLGTLKALVEVSRVEPRAPSDESLGVVKTEKAGDDKKVVHKFKLSSKRSKIKNLQLFTQKSIFKMAQFLQEIRYHFNLILTQNSVTLTLINPNITIQTMQHIKDAFRLSHKITKLQIVILQCPNFDDQLLTVLAQGIPQSVTDLTLDFSGCQSLRGEGFLQLFERLDPTELTKLNLDLGQVININDIVIQGLCLFLSNQDELTDVSLDFYELDMLSEDSYLLLAETIADMKNLKSLYLDFSANPNLNEDALEILFGGLSHHLHYFTFKILDIEHVGGGSFFKLGQSLGEMTELKKLDLTLSTFTNLNPKGVHSVLKSIQKLSNLTSLKLNISNIDLAEKMLTYLNFSKCLQELTLDISCNRKISFRDFINLGTKINKIKKIDLNLDFCSNIGEDVIEQVVEMIADNNQCTSLVLRDRNYSLQFQNEVASKLVSMQSLMNLQVFGKCESKKFRKVREMLAKKQRLLGICLLNERSKVPKMITNGICDLLFYEQ